MEVLGIPGGVYILQNTMVGGGIKMAAGEKIWKLRVWGKKWKNWERGKRKKEKNGLKTT